jgi:tetratricopeptide (TPR) repeat protein
MRLSKWFALGLVLSACNSSPEPAPLLEAEPAPAPAPVAQLPPIAVEVPAPAAPAVVEEKLELPATYRETMKLAKSSADLADKVALYEHAASLLPDKSAPHIELARIYIGEKQLREARKHAELALDLEPTSGGWNTLGRIELLDGDKPAAIAAFGKAVEVNPDNAFGWNNLGLVHLQLGQHAEAIEALERATSGDKPEGYMWLNLATAYEKSDQLELARAAYRQAAKHGSDAAKAAIARLDGEVPSTAKLPGEDEPAAN